MKNVTLCLWLLLLVLGCKDQEKSKQSIKSEEVTRANTEKAKDVLASTIKAHGGKAYDTAHYQFTFRKKTYTFNNKIGYVYTVVSIDSLGNTIIDSLINGRLERNINGTSTSLSNKDITKYSEALNSVIYFATLPHKLTDAAVNARYIEETSIKVEDYDVVEVTFGKNGGGTDYDDVFCYWIQKQSNYIDYLAYSYKTNNGGVRFRSAYNPRTIDGIRFQDYINWEAPLGTSLKELPVLYENDQLKELSRIETEAIINLDATAAED